VNTWICLILDDRRRHRPTNAADLVFEDLRLQLSKARELPIGVKLPPEAALND